MLCRRTFEQRANFSTGTAILGRRGLQKAMQQGRCCGDVLARPSEVRESPIIGEDPPMHITGQGTRVPTVSAALDLLLDVLVFPDKLLPGIIDLQLSCS